MEQRLDVTDTYKRNPNSNAKRKIDRRAETPRKKAEFLARIEDILDI
jgi:hypothetical protein